jgi:hypothetical protein
MTYFKNGEFINLFLDKRTLHINDQVWLLHRTLESSLR